MYVDDIILCVSLPRPGDFLSGPVAKDSALPMQELQVRSLVRELDPTWSAAKTRQLNQYI